MKISKRILGIVGVAATTVLLAACGNSKSSNETTITVGASAVPHAQILKHVAPQLKKGRRQLESQSLPRLCDAQQGLSQQGIRCQLLPTHSILKGVE